MNNDNTLNLHGGSKCRAGYATVSTFKMKMHGPTYTIMF